MKKTDKFLITIVVGVVVLIVISLFVARVRPSSAEFLPDDNTPEHIAYNYLLAVEQKEYSRAYRYLSPSLPGYPTDLDMFVRDVRLNLYDYHYSNDLFRSVTLSKTSDNTAWVNVRETHFYQDGGLLPGSQYSENYEVALRQEGGQWLIIESDRYWYYCWDFPTQAGCGR